VRPDGTSRGQALPVSARARQVASGKNRKAYFTDAYVTDPASSQSVHLREYVAPTYDETTRSFTGGVIVAQPLTSTDHALGPADGISCASR